MESSSSPQAREMEEGEAPSQSDNGNDKKDESERSSSKGRHHHHRRHHRSGGRSRSGSRSRSPSPSRSRSPSPSPRQSHHHGHHRRSRSGSAEREREEREPERDRGRSRSPDRPSFRGPNYSWRPDSYRRGGFGRGGGFGHPPRFRRQRSPTPPPEDPEREMRTVFCYQLAQQLRDKDLVEFFTVVGPVRNAKIISDRNSRRSKGAAYVEFEKMDDVENAIKLTGTRLLGVPIIVTLTQAEKNRQAMLKTTAPSKPPQAVPGRIFVSNYPSDLPDEDIKRVFDPFGDILSVEVHPDGAFILFASGLHAKLACDRMNGFNLAGRALTVTMVSERETTNGSGSNEGSPLVATRI